MNASTPTIIITSSRTLIDDAIVEPQAITVVLDSGVAYDIGEIVHILNKRKSAKKPGRFSRFKTAFKTALDESEEQQFTQS